MALKCFALMTISASAFQTFPIVMFSVGSLVVLMGLGMECVGFYWVEEQLLPVALFTFVQLLVNLESQWKCRDQKCLSLLSVFLDQREASCPLQDPHLLLFGHSAPNLLTALSSKQKTSQWGGSKASKVLVGLGLLWVSGFGKYTWRSFNH